MPDKLLKRRIFEMLKVGDIDEGESEARLFISYLGQCSELTYAKLSRQHEA